MEHELADAMEPYKTIKQKTSKLKVYYTEFKNIDPSTKELRLIQYLKHLQKLKKQVQK